MKITDFKTFVVGVPPPHYGGRYWIFLKLTTDSGINGYGEAYSIPFHPHVVARMIEDVCQRKVIGEDPFQIERLWRIIYSSGYTQRPDTSTLGVLSAIEMACWDIVGKASKKSCDPIPISIQSSRATPAPIPFHPWPLKERYIMSIKALRP
jgi:2-dehydro-3-deoxyphosphogalactonate aldolase